MPNVRLSSYDPPPVCMLWEYSFPALNELYYIQPSVDRGCDVRPFATRETDVAGLIDVHYVCMLVPRVRVRRQLSGVPKHRLLDIKQHQWPVFSGCTLHCRAARPKHIVTS